MGWRGFVTGLCAALLASPVMAGVLDGKWSASVDSPQGAIALTFDFRSEGNRIAGSVSIAGVGNLPITDGAVKGSDVTFTVTLAAGGAPLVVRYSGKVSGDRLDLTSVFDAGSAGPMETRLAATRLK